MLRSVMISMVRRALPIVAVVTGALLIGCGSGQEGQGLTRVELLLDWKAEPTYAGFFIAQDIGAYRRRKLDVRIAEGSGATVAAQVIGAGNQYLIGSASGAATAIAVSNGVPVVSVAVLYPEVPTVIYSRSDTPIREPRDLVGRRIGLISGSITVDEYRGMMAANGVDTSMVTHIGVGWDVAPLLTNRVDALLNYAELTPVELRIQGRQIETMRLSDFGVKAYSLNLIVNSSRLATDSATIRQVVEAVVEGYEFIRANPDSAAKLFSRRFTERDTVFVRESIRIVAEQLGTGTVGDQTTMGWEQTIAMLDQLGLLRNTISVEQVAPLPWRSR